MAKTCPCQSSEIKTHAARLPLPASGALSLDQASKPLRKATSSRRAPAVTTSPQGGCRFHRNPPQPTRSRGKERKGARANGGRPKERLHSRSRLRSRLAEPALFEHALLKNSRPARSTRRCHGPDERPSSSHSGKIRRESTREDLRPIPRPKVTLSRRGRIQSMSSAVHTTRLGQHHEGDGRRDEPG